MDFNWITQGELAAGQYITMVGLKPVKKEIITPIGEVRTITEEDKNPWIKGVPFQVIKVALPLVMVKNICNVPNIPAAVFYDTRLIDFIEVDEEYANAYKKTMFPPKEEKGETTKPVTASQTSLVNSPIPSDAEEVDEQTSFNFGGDEPESGTSLVPK